MGVQEMAPTNSERPPQHIEHQRNNVLAVMPMQTHTRTHVHAHTHSKQHTHIANNTHHTHPRQQCGVSGVKVRSSCDICRHGTDQTHLIKHTKRHKQNNTQPPHTKKHTPTTHHTPNNTHHPHAHTHTKHYVHN